MSADVLSYLRRLLPAVDPQQPDGELLRRYAATGSEGEFTELLRRHGPLVWAVCRRVLGNAHAAEDVFQATFLQLARRAGTLRRDGSLAGWLHTVATRLAHRALLAEQRRRRRERAHVSSRPPSADDLTWRELRQMLDAEIARLPEAYRQPLILCYLENRPQIEAARRLGLPPAVLRGRLERGRQKLRQRLEKLGLPLAATLLLTKTEPVPAALLEATRQTVCCALAGGPVPSAVAALTTGRSLLSRLKIGALAAVLLITGGVGIDGASRPARPEEKPKDNPGKAAAVRQDLYGDPLPAGVLARLGTARQRAPDSHLAVTADGKEVVAVSSELTVRRFDARTGALRSVRQLPGAGMFSSFRNWLSPRGTLLLVGGVSGPGKYHLSLWDLDKGKIRQTLQLPGQDLAGVAFSADERLVAVADSSTQGKHRVLVWDPETSKSRILWTETKEINDRYFEPIVALSPDGKRLVACHLDQILRGWDVASGKLLWQSEKKYWTPFIFFSPDGRTVVAPANIGVAGLHVRDAATGKLLEGRTPPPKEAIVPIGFSPDGRFLAFQTGLEEVVLWEPGKEKIAFRSPRPLHHRDAYHFTPESLPTNFAFTPDGKRFIRRAGALQCWDLASGKPLYADTENWGHTGEVTRLLFSPDGRLLASSSRDQTARLWDVATARTAHSIPKASDHLAFTADSRRLLLVPSGLAKTVLQATDVATGRPERGFELADRREFMTGSREKELRVTADGKKIMMLTWKNGKRGDESVLTVWNTATGECLVHRRVPWSEDSLLTPDGQSVLAVDSTERVVKLLSVETGEPRWQFRPDRPIDRLTAWGSELALSPNGRLMASRNRSLNLLNLRMELDAIRLGDMANGKQLLRIPMDGPAVFDFSADNRLFAVAGSDSVRFWETATWQPIGALKVEVGASNPPDRACARSLAFSPDGRTLATGHADGTLLLWDASLRGGTHGGPLDAARCEELWKDLASVHAGHAYAAIWRLADDPATAAFLKERLKAAPPPAPDLIRSLLNDLESDQFAVREAAERKLRELGERAGSALRESLKAKPSLEKRRRTQALLTLLDGNSLLSGEPLREVRAVQVLEEIGSAEARTVLERLAEGVGSARLTREAKAALGRMRH